MYLGTYFYMFNQLDDIFISQPYTAFGTSSSNSLRSIGTMNTYSSPFGDFKTDEIRAIYIPYSPLVSPIFGILNRGYLKNSFWSTIISIVALIAFVFSTCASKSTQCIRLAINHIHPKRFFRNHNCILSREATSRKQKRQ